jgi:hypothetical protein
MAWASNNPARVNAVCQGIDLVCAARDYLIENKDFKTKKNEHSYDESISLV